MAESYGHLQGKEQDVSKHPDNNLPERTRQELNAVTAEKYPWNAPPEKTKPAMPEFGEGRFK